MMGLQTENQLPGVPGGALKVCGGWVVVTDCMPSQTRTVR